MSKITALMSVYNGEKFIRESIESIINQSYSNFQLLIIDDASTDETVKIIKSFNDKRIRLIELKDNIGVGAALRYSLDFIDTEYVIKVDSDDINHKDRFLLQKEFMDDNPDIALAKTLIRYFADDNEVLNSNRFKYLNEIKLKAFNEIRSSEDISKYINYWFCIPHNSIIIRTEVLKKIKYENIRLGEDYTLFYKMNKLGYKMATIDKVLVDCRVRKGSITALSAGNNSLFEYVFDLKKKDILEFIGNSKECYIWGTGTLSKAFYTKLISNLPDLNVLGFIDGTLLEGEYGDFLGHRVYSKEVLNKKKIKTILAASPALFIAMRYFKENNYELGRDYYIY